MYETTYGSKYEQGLDVAEIAKRIRADITVASSLGRLPALTVSVTIERYSGGQSLNVRIKEVPEGFQIINHARVRLEHENSAYWMRSADHYPRYTVEAQAVLKAIKGIVAAYNFDGSDVQSDYFHVNFYFHVGFDSHLEQTQREQIVAELTGAPPPEPLIMTTETVTAYYHSPAWRSPRVIISAQDLADHFNVPVGRAKKFLGSMVEAGSLFTTPLRRSRGTGYRLPTGAEGKG